MRISRTVFAFALAGALIVSLSNLALAQPVAHENHYKVYRSTPITIVKDVGLRDQFGPLTVTDLVFDKFSTPADKIHNGQNHPMVNPLVHLDWWHINYPQPSRTVIVTDQFGSGEWVVKDARYLLLPAVKNAGPGTPPPVWNHYLCYDVVTGPIVNQPVVLIDQFGTAQVHVRYAKLLCNPVEKTVYTATGPVVYPIIDATTHLACYEVLNPQPYAINITAQDQFGFWQTTLQINDCMCVPALKDHPVRTEKSTWGRVKALYQN
jgi:hypothetical protein